MSILLLLLLVVVVVVLQSYTINKCLNRLYI